MKSILRLTGEEYSKIILIIGAILFLLMAMGCTTPRAIYYNCSEVVGNDIREADGQDTRFDCEHRGLISRIINIF
jgi:hypothetical protein